MPTHVQYDGKRLIPAPFVQVNKVYNKTADGEIVGSTFTLNITGKMLAYKGSPNSSGVFFTGSQYPGDESVPDAVRLSAIIRKQEAIRTLFKDEGRQMEFQSADGSQPMKCNPRVVSIEFANDQWYQSFDYSINLEADVVTVNGVLLGEDNFPNYLEDASESWSFDTNEDESEDVNIPRTYKVTHTVSAKGKRFYNSANALQKTAWKQAQAYVQPKLGFDATIALSSGVNNLPSYYVGYNWVRNENIDEQGGSYSVTESFVVTSGSAIEEYTISTKTSLDSGLTQVTVDGNIKGLEARNSNFSLNTTKYANADVKFSGVQPIIFTRAQVYSRINLNVIPTSTTVGRNPLAGTINYSYDFDNRPSNIFTGSRSESVSVVDNFGEEEFATIFILGRTVGPIIQNLNTKRARNRTLSVELVMPIASGSIRDRFYTNKPSILPSTSGTLQTLVSTLNPANFGASPVRVASQSTNWDGSRFSYNVSWTYELNQATII